MFKKRMNKKLLIIFTASILIFIAGYGKIAYAAAGNGSNTLSADRENRIFDPFMLDTYVLTTENGVVVSRPPIRINTRPTVRSFFRPALVF